MEKIKKQRQNDEAFKRISLLCKHRNELIEELRNIIPYDDNRYLGSLYNDLLDNMKSIMLEETKSLVSSGL